MVLPAPENQESLFGHEAAEKTLLDIYNRGTLAGSWLICGDKGIGKATLAFRLARFLLSGDVSADQDSLFGDTAAPPSSLAVSANSPVFKEVAMRAHPDLKVLECALKDKELKERQAVLESGRALDEETERKRTRFDEIRVDDIRTLDDFMHLTSSIGGWRVVILDSADDMNVNAANSLLKLLEEPKAKTVFLLIAHHPASLLPTIRSRCRKIQLKPLSDDTVSRLLQSGFPDLSETARRSLCVLAEGSIGKAAFLAENNGTELYEKMTGLFDRFPDFSASDLYAFTDTAMKDKNQIPMLEELFLMFLTRAAHFAVAPERLTEACAGEFSRLQRVASSTDAVSFLNKIDEIKAAFRDKDLDQKQVFVNACTLLADKGAALC